MTTDLETLRADLAAARIPPSRRRVAFFAAIAAVTVSAVAFAADRYLGQPAPAHVKATFARLGGWQHLDPVDPRTAKVVAFSAHSVVYGAQTAGGGTCVELLGKGGFEYEVFCDRSRPADGVILFSSIIPVHGTASSLPPVAVSGRVGRNVASLEARTNGATEHVRLGLDGFFSFEPRDQAAARRGQTWFVGRDASGSVVGRARMPAQLVVDTEGSPPRVVHGLSFDPRARRALFEIWAYVRMTGDPRHCRPQPICRSSGYAQTGTTGSVAIARDGSFTYRPPHGVATKWFLSVVIADGRFIPIDPVGGWNIPDAAYWKKARTEARG